jgi:type I restriction enzyme S subunit
LSDAEVSATLLAEGDLLLTKSSGSSLHIGKTSLVDADVAAMRCGYSNFMQRLRMKATYFPRLAWYFLNNDVARRQFDLLSHSTTGLANLNGTIIGDLVLPVPPRTEQAAITAFLDRETAKIDALIAEQQRLIELLQEKRQAVISHAVTKGLNPDVPMKDSGIEWLGAVPEHWSVMAAKRVSSVFVPQRNKPELNTDGDGVCWVTMEQMRNEEITTTDLWVSEAAACSAGTRVLRAGAVIASCVGTFGIAAINKADVIINQQLQAFIPGEGIDTNFLRHCVVNSAGYFEQIGTAATITYVNHFGFENMPLAVPPLEEQAEIVDSIARYAARLDALTAEAERGIELLQERRSALISAAGTGQIDVRGLGETSEAA